MANKGKRKALAKKASAAAKKAAASSTLGPVPSRLEYGTQMFDLGAHPVLRGSIAPSTKHWAARLGIRLK